jgi:hypothetical protein
MPPKTTSLPTSLPKIPRRPLTVTTTPASGGPMRTVTPRSSRFDPLFDVNQRKLNKFLRKFADKFAIKSIDTLIEELGKNGIEFDNDSLINFRRKISSDHLFTPKAEHYNSKLRHGNSPIHNFGRPIFKQIITIEKTNRLYDRIKTIKTYISFLDITDFPEITKSQREDIFSVSGNSYTGDFEFKFKNEDYMIEITKRRKADAILRTRRGDLKSDKVSLFFAVYKNGTELVHDTLIIDETVDGNLHISSLHITSGFRDTDSEYYPINELIKMFFQEDNIPVEVYRGLSEELSEEPSEEPNHFIQISNIKRSLLRAFICKLFIAIICKGLALTDINERISGGKNIKQLSKPKKPTVVKPKKPSVKPKKSSVKPKKPTDKPKKPTVKPKKPAVKPKKPSVKPKKPTVKPKKPTVKPKKPSVKPKKPANM